MSTDDETSDERTLRKLDFSDIRFPSDGLSIAALRKAHAPDFDHGCVLVGNDAQPRFFLSANNDLDSRHSVGILLFNERIVAAAGFCAVTGIQLNYGSTLLDLRDNLANLYIQYGLAAGHHEAEQLVRTVDKQGRSLALASHHLYCR
jgi:hypothetical protein